MKNVCVWLTLAVSILGCGSPKDNRSGQEETKPLNVLFIVVDDLNKTLGCYDHPLVKTPHIDGLAARGIQFDQAHCNFAVCNPSRSSFLTGMTPETTTIQDNRLPLQEIIGDWVTLPALFRQNGYYTMSLGKIFHGNAEKHNDPKAWDEIYGFGASELGRTGEGRNMTDGKLKWCSWLAAEGSDEDQADGQNAKKAVEFLKSDHEKPFFLAVGFHKPHDPFNAPKNYFDLYPIEDCDPPVLPEGWEPPYEHSLPGETDVFNKFTDREKREFLKSYYACCSFMDAQVGKVLQALEESGQAEHTLIVFFGDHGYHLGEHNWWNKVTIYEKGSSAPFILAGGPVEKKGIRSDAMFEFIDIYPTLAELCALEDTPDYLEGRSFATLIQDPSQSFRSEVRAIVRRGEKTGRMVKNSQWRYIEWDQGRMGNELYDQLKDPIEYHNLAGDPAYAEVVADMKALIHLDH